MSPVTHVRACFYCASDLETDDLSVTSFLRAREAHESACPELLEYNLEIEREAAERVSAWFDSGDIRASMFESERELEIRLLRRDIIDCHHEEHVWATKDGKRIYLKEMDTRHVVYALAKIIRDPEDFEERLDDASREVWVHQFRHELRRRLDEYVDWMLLNNNPIENDPDRKIRDFGRDLKRAMGAARSFRERKDREDA
jgi:hypothetical protein